MGQIKVEKNVGGIEGLCVIEPAVHGDTHGKRNLLRIVGWTHCFGLQGYQNAY